MKKSPIERCGELTYNTYIVGSRGDEFLTERVATWTITAGGDTDEEAKETLLERLNRLFA